MDEDGERERERRGGLSLVDALWRWITMDRVEMDKSDDQRTGAWSEGGEDGPTEVNVLLVDVGSGVRERKGREGKWPDPWFPPGSFSSLLSRSRLDVSAHRRVQAVCPGRGMMGETRRPAWVGIG